MIQLHTNIEYDLRSAKGIEYIPCNFSSRSEQIKLKSNQICRVYDRNWDWGPCTPFGRNIVSSDTTPFNLTADAFGYKAGTPCVLLRLNRVKTHLYNSTYCSKSAVPRQLNSNNSTPRQFNSKCRVPCYKAHFNS